MAIRISSVLAILIGTLFLSVGQGLHQALIPIAGGEFGFKDVTLSVLASVYFGGYLLGCFICPTVVKRVGHTRTLAIAASLLSILSLCHILMPHAVLWVLFRVFVGITFACIDVVMESWLADRAEPKDRGKLLSFYRLIDLFALGTGQILIAAAPPTAFVLFALVAILISVAVIVVAGSTAPTPSPPQNVSVRLKYVWMISPLAMVTAVLHGIASGAYWGFAPVFAAKVSDSLAMAGILLATTLAGAAVAQFPVGWASDRFERRRLIAVFGFVAALVSFGVFGISFKLPELLLPGLFLFGMAAFSIYPVAMTYAFDRAKPEDFVEVGAAILVVYGAGAFVGPLLVPVLLLFGNYSGVFVLIGMVYAAIGGYAVYRILNAPPPAPADTVDFVAMPATTSVAVEMDPRVNKSENG